MYTNELAVVASYQTPDLSDIILFDGLDLDIAEDVSTIASCEPVEYPVCTTSRSYANMIYIALITMLYTLAINS